MRVAVVGNAGDDDDGFVGERLRDLGATFSRYERDDPDTLKTADQDVELLVLLGSDWSVYDEKYQRSVESERSLVLRAQQRNLPILGICFGGQLISSALGLVVAPTSLPEIGWRQLQTHDERLIASGPWFQFHFDRWTDGAGITSIAHTESGPQGYWYGKTLALQFHPEVTLPTVERWCVEGKESLLVAGEDLDRVMADTAREIERARQRCHQLVDQFLAHAQNAKYPEAR